MSERAGGQAPRKRGEGGKSRFLFVTPPLAGHVNPMSGVAQALAGRGHEVAWAGSEMLVRPLLGPDATVYPTGSRVYRQQSDRGLAAVRSLWERFIMPFTRFTLPGVEKAVQAYAPDALVVDQHAPAGALVAHRHGLPWATMACSGMELTRPFASLPKVQAWVEGNLTRLWAAAGLPPQERLDLLFSPYLVISLSGTALTGDVAFPPHFALVGPALADRPAPDFPWDWLDPGRRHVLVTMGTLADELTTDFYHRAVEAVRPLADRVQAVVVAPDGTVPDPPAHVLAMPRVPLLTLLPHLDAVLSHGGLNTVCETLAHGVPLLVAPIRHDQPINAAQVAAAGAGIRVPFARVGAERLRAAVTAVLEEPGYRAAAGRVRESFAAAGGAPAAAALLERLPGSTPDEPPTVVRHRRPALA
jgi:UDP:flavonoid glycosyltransferase YjiC (YdhE family)